MLKKISKFFVVVCRFLCLWRYRGTVCFTFDDFGGDNWLNADKIFKKYDAHATFLVCGELTEKHVEVMKKLQEAGHTVGLHTVNHANAVSEPQEYMPESFFMKQIKPQLDICIANNINVVAFAYPNNRHNNEFDEYLYQYFDFLRVGVGAKKKPIYIPMKKLQSQMLLQGIGIGQYYNSNMNELKKILDHASKTNSMTVFFSHDIYPNAPHVHMPQEWLEELLRYAKEKRIRVIGAKEIK